MLNCIIENLFWTRSKCLNYIKKTPTNLSSPMKRSVIIGLSLYSSLSRVFVGKIWNKTWQAFFLKVFIDNWRISSMIYSWYLKMFIFFLRKDVPFRSTFDWVMKNVLPDTSRIPWRRGGPSARRIRHRNSLTVCRHLSENLKEFFLVEKQGSSL